MPLAEPDGPGVGTGYTIPTGNLFNEAEDTDNKTLPEIFAMGFRNPFRITVDPISGQVLMGDYGPDAERDEPEPRPAGRGRVQHRHARLLWLAVLHPRQRPLQRLRLRHRHLRAEVQLRGAGQQLAQQHGPDQPAAGQAGGRCGWATPRPTPRNPGPRHAAAPRPAARATSSTRTSTPTRSSRRTTTSQWFIGEWNSGWIKTATLNADSTAVTNVADDAVDGHVPARPRDGVRA